MRISRSAIARTSLVAAILVLSVFLFHAGKEHIIYLDTNSVGTGTSALRAPEMSAVYVDGAEEPEEMGRAERAMVTVMGPRHEVRVEPLDGDGEPVTRKLVIPVTAHDVIVSIPAILAGAPDDAVMYAFVVPSYEDEPAEQTVQQEESDVIQLIPAP